MRTSIALRLTAWYATTVALLVIGAVGLQYRALSRDLVDEDDQLLLETLAAARAGALPPRPLAKQAAELGPIVRIYDLRCRPSAATSAAVSREPLPPSYCASSSARPTFYSWASSRERPWRIVTQQIALPQTQTVEVLLNRWTDEKILSGYRHELATVAGVALVAAIIVGFAMARRSLRPLDELAALLTRVDASSLGDRVVMHDIPDELARVLSSFDAMRERLNSAFASLTELSADLAHELRTPIHVLRQRAEITLTRTREPDEYREVLGSILEELDRMRRMVDDTLFLARAEDPRFLVQRDSLDLRDEVASIVEFMEPLASDVGIRLESSVDAAIALVADRLLLRRALVNLVANAIRHTPSGGHVVVAVSADPGAVRVSVEDTGYGIPTDILPRVFDRHFRYVGAAVAPDDEALSSRDAESDPPGAGLGLAIVRGIMKLHRGRATIKSRAGEGTRVTLTFPSDG